MLTIKIVICPRRTHERFLHCLSYSGHLFLPAPALERLSLLQRIRLLRADIQNSVTMTNI